MIEAVRGDRARLTSEAADVLYHLLVMLAARDVTLAECWPNSTAAKAPAALPKRLALMSARKGRTPVQAVDLAGPVSVE